MYTHKERGHAPYWSQQSEKKYFVRFDYVAFTYTEGSRGSIMVKSLLCKPESRGFETR
jgi:hypothetical protein